MRKLLLFVPLLLLVHLVCAQVAISKTGQIPDASAMLHVQDSAKGFLLPRLTAIQRTAIVSPAKGLIIYQVDSIEGLYINTGTPAAPTWRRFDTASSPVAFSASTNKYQLTYTAPFVKLRFEKENHNQSGSYDTTSAIFTAPSAGVYHFDVSVYYNAYSGNPKTSLAFFINNIESKTTFLQTTSGSYSYFILSLAADVLLATGDQVDVRMGTSGGYSDVPGNNSRYTVFSGHQVK